MVAIILGVATLHPSAPAVTPEMITEANTAAAERRAERKAKAEASTKAEAAKPVTAFIGDSYTTGAGAPPGKAWTSVLAAEQGLSAYRSFANGGTGYATSVARNARVACGLDECPMYIETVPAVVDYQPTTVIVSGGRNDLGKPPAVIEKQANELFTELSTNLPNATIIVTSPIWDARKAPAQLDALAAAVKSAAANAGATYVDLGQPFKGRGELITGDLVHPNEDGHKLLAEIVSKKLAAIKR